MNEIIKLSSPSTREFWKIPVLFEDEHLLALDKPSLLLSSPDRYNLERPNLINLLHRDIQRGAPWAKQRRITYLANAHRLDFEATGVILLAKDKPTLIALVNQFSAEMRAKVYIALAHGARPEGKFQVDSEVGTASGEAGHYESRREAREEIANRFRSDRAIPWIYPAEVPAADRPNSSDSSSSAISGFAHRRGCSLWRQSIALVRLKPDYRFKAKQEERPLIGRAALHAELLTVKHPIGGTSIEIVAPWPKDLKVGVKYLKKYAS